MTQLKAGLRDAELVSLRPGQRYEQHSSIVLLTGTLRATGWTSSPPPGVGEVGDSTPAQKPRAPAKKASAGPSSKGGNSKHFEVHVQFQGPTVLPWLWEDEVRGDGEVLRRHAPVPLYCASPGGA